MYYKFKYVCSLNSSPRAIDWFRSYLYGYQQCACIENVNTFWRITSKGVTQLISSYHLYADDFKIYSQTTADTSCLCSGSLIPYSVVLHNVCGVTVYQSW